MGLVEEEHHGGLVQVADLQQGLEELGEQPHEEGGEQRALGLDVGQLQGGDDAPAVGEDPHEVAHVKRRPPPKLWVCDGEVSDAVLNEACSSGCGSFIEGTAHALHVSPATFAEEALRAKSPLDLGTKCTVFMTSRVRHAQKIAAPRADIAAGIAYSVVRNVLYRIIGRKRASQLKGTVVVQGGAFKSDAVLRAFELVCGVETVRPDIAHLMGAYGAALIARERAADALFGGLIELAHAKPPSPLSPSGLLSVAQLEALDPVRRTIRCPGCANACTLALVSFGEERLFISGNRCSRAESFVDARSRALDPGEVENIRERDGRSSGLRGTRSYADSWILWKKARSI